jgi:uncharacterized RDD family membrane protein YckC
VVLSYTVAGSRASAALIDYLICLVIALALIVGVRQFAGRVSTSSAGGASAIVAWAVVVNPRGKRLGDMAAGTIVVKEDLISQPMVARPRDSQRDGQRESALPTVARLTDAGRGGGWRDSCRRSPRGRCATS